MSEQDSPQNPGTALTPQAVPAAATATGTGIKFDFTYNNVDYDVQVYAPDVNGQYGFTVTEASTTAGSTPTTVASLVYLPANAATNTPEGWSITVSLPKQLQVDTNLVVNTLSVQLSKGTTKQLSGS